MNFLDQVTNFSANNHVWLGIICLVLASWLRFIAVGNLAVWRSIFAPVQPRLQADFSPAERVRAGIMGCITGSIANVLALGLLLVGLDLLIFAGAVAQWVINFAG